MFNFYIIIYLRCKHMIKKINDSTETAFFLVVHDLGQPLLFFCCCIDSLIRLRCYIYLICLFYCIIFFSNKISKNYKAITARKIIFFIKFCFYNSTDFLFWDTKNSLFESYGLFTYIIIYISIFKI